MKTETVINEDGAEVEVVPAEVARGLYEALEVVYTLGLDDTQERIVEKALAAADGEDV